jgi:hypothetical protein
MDLKEERAAVTWEVLNARHIPVGMENFSAANDRGWKTITNVIDNSDYYVLILAGKYGSIDKETDKSWTQREYEYAVEKNLPVLAFIREDSSITANMIEKTPKKKKKLEDFKNTIIKTHLKANWTSADDLKSKVVHALHNAIEDDEDSGNPRPGWFRGDVIPSAQAMDEFAALSSENRELKEQVEELTKVDDSNIVLLHNGRPLEDMVLERPFLQVSNAREQWKDYFNSKFSLSLSIASDGPSVVHDSIIEILIESLKDVQFTKWHVDSTIVSSVELSGNRFKHRISSLAPGFDEHIGDYTLYGNPVAEGSDEYRISYKIGGKSRKLTEYSALISLKYSEPQEVSLGEAHAILKDY